MKWYIVELRNMHSSSRESQVLVGSLNLCCRKGRERMRKMAKFNGTPAPEEHDRSFPSGS